MTTNQKISLALLIGRLIAVSIMFLVIRKQWKVLSSKKYPELRKLRYTLLAGSIILIVANVFPIVLDSFGVFGKGSFNLLLAYVFSNNLTAILYSYMLWYNVRLAEKIKISDTEK